MDGSTGSSGSAASTGRQGRSRRQHARLRDSEHATQEDAQKSAHTAARLRDSEHATHEVAPKSEHTACSQGISAPDPHIFDVYADTDGAATLPLLPTSAPEYIAVQDAINVLLAAPRFVPMSVPAASVGPATEAFTELQTALEQAQSEVRVLRDECTASDSVIAQLEEGTRQLRGRLREDVESIHEVSALLDECTASDAVVAELEQSTHSLRDQLRESTATADAATAEARDESHAVGILKQQLLTALSSRRHDRYELSRCEGLLRMRSLEHQQTEVRLESSLESRQISDEHLERLRRHSEMLEQQLLLRMS